MIKHLGVAIGLFAAALTASPPAVAQSANTSAHPLFSENTSIDVVIEGPIAELIRRAPASTDPFPAHITIAGGAERYALEIAPRGVSRRTLGICQFPPLRLNFERRAMRGTVFEGQNRLKLVTRCRNGAQYEQINAREYLAYRLYNLISPHSYRVRPLRVTFRDTARGAREQVHQGFVIEDVDDVARRSRLVELDVPVDTVNSSQLDGLAATRYAVFQFMIGNLDWDMVSGRAGEDCCHNSRLLAATQTTRSGVVPAPYDFDYSGLVDAPYAVPPAQMSNLRDVRQRVYRGYCRFNEHVPAVIQEFLAQRQAISQTIATEGWLSDSSRRGAQRYIDQFFEIAEDPARVQRQIIERCR